MLEVIHDHVADLIHTSEDSSEFIMLRRKGFGASDAASLLGVSPFKSINQLIQEKKEKAPTLQELLIGKLPNVRKGIDLEPLILGKFEEWSGVLVNKPTAMYRIKEYPYITVNFDGLTMNDIPVECKYVSKPGEGRKGNKYWDHSKALDSIDASISVTYVSDTRVTPDLIKRLANLCGIPVYYYTQLQHQMLASEALYGYLAALHDTDWILRVYYVPRNQAVIDALKVKAYSAWNKISPNNDGINV